MEHEQYMQKSTKENRTLEYINYDGWLPNADKLKYRINIKGNDYKSHILIVRNLIYKNKIYAFNYQEDRCNHDYATITLKIELDGIVDAYNITI